MIVRAKRKLVPTAFYLAWFCFIEGTIPAGSIVLTYSFGNI